MVFAFAGDSTTTSAFAIELLMLAPYPLRSLLFTLTRFVKPDEPATAGPRDQSLHFELE